VGKTKTATRCYVHIKVRSPVAWRANLDHFRARACKQNVGHARSEAEPNTTVRNSPEKKRTNTPVTHARPQSHTPLAPFSAAPTSSSCGSTLPVSSPCWVDCPPTDAADPRFPVRCQDATPNFRRAAGDACSFHDGPSSQPCYPAPKQHRDDHEHKGVAPKSRQQFSSGSTGVHLPLGPGSSPNDRRIVLLNSRTRSLPGHCFPGKLATGFNDACQLTRGATKFTGERAERQRPSLHEQLTHTG
jgi:hypothetical protein